MDNNSVVEDCITKALYKLIDKKKLENITIKELVEQAGVSRISFYRHYDSKIDVLHKELDKMIDKYINEYYQELNNSNLEYNIINLFNLFYEYKDLGTTLYKSNSLYLIQQQFYKSIDTKLSKYDLYARSFYSGGIYNTLLLWISTGYKEKPEFLVNIILNILKRDL